MSLFTNIYTQNSRESMDKILDLKENSKIKENDGGSKFNNNIFDMLQELL
jgi:hypothetical protein